MSCTIIQSYRFLSFEIFKYLKSEQESQTEENCFVSIQTIKYEIQNTWAVFPCFSLNIKVFLKAWQILWRLFKWWKRKALTMCSFLKCWKWSKKFSWEKKVAHKRNAYQIEYKRKFLYVSKNINGFNLTALVSLECLQIFLHIQCKIRKCLL